MAEREAASELVTLYPTGRAHILGDPIVGSPPELITEADEATAAVLLSYSPPAFSTAPTPFSDELERPESGDALPHQTIVRVPYDNYPALLHKGERVQTAADAARGGSGGETHFHVHLDSPAVFDPYGLGADQLASALGPAIGRYLDQQRMSYGR